LEEQKLITDHPQDSRKNGYGSGSVEERMGVIDEVFEDISGEFGGEIEGIVGQALMMHYSDRNTKEIEVKNEQGLIDLDVKVLKEYQSLRCINFSMNSIAEIT
jgi:hypothetical protein